MADRSLNIEQSNIRRRAWIFSGALHLMFFGLIAIEVSLKAATALDLVFYIFCAPGILVGFPIAMLFGVGGPHGEGVFFGILFGLPFNVIAYYWVAILVMQISKKISERKSNPV
jgi:hypothetical protein